jgi:glycosyltransferase involved in cell wall biosynthesis
MHTERRAPEGSHRPAYMARSDRASRLRVILTAGSLAEKYGGPSRTISGLAVSLQKNGVDTVLVTGLSPQLDGPSVLPDALLPILCPAEVSQYGPLRLYPEMRELITRQINGTKSHACIIHDNGVWGHYNSAAFAAADRAGIPYLLSPRGMLEQWSLRQKRWRKAAAMAAFQHRILAGTTAFVATAHSEADSVRRLGLKQPIAVVPNGIDLTADDARGARAPSQARTMLFLSRVHPKKGLPLLVQAWALIRPSGWVLQIAGPDEAGHEAEVRRLIAALGVEESISFVGPVEGDRKKSLLRESDVFVLPTHSENFGVAIAEALNAGLPVITTKGAPWSDLPTHGCGWWVDISVDSLAKALQQATRLTDSERAEMSSRGRAYVARFAWPQVARQMNDVYDWAVGRRDAPPCVRWD